MTWELRKIGGSGRLCLLLLLAVNTIARRTSENSLW